MATETSGRSTDPFVQFYRWVFGLGYERNVGGPERAVRYTLGALSVLAGLGVVAVPVLGGALTDAALGLGLLATGLYLIYEARTQYCPVNHTIGRSTYRE